MQVISRAAPQAAAIVLSQMADRLLHARRAHGTTKSLRRVFSPAVPSASRRPGMAQSSATPADQKVAQRMGDIVTIAIVPAGMPPPQRTVPRAASALRRCSYPVSWPLWRHHCCELICRHAYATISCMLIHALGSGVVCLKPTCQAMRAIVHPKRQCDENGLELLCAHRLSP